MGFGSAPKQPSMEEQYAFQKKIQDQANSEAVTKSEAERRKASLERQRTEAKRRSGSSLISSRQGGLLANETDTGVGLQTLYTQE